MTDLTLGFAVSFADLYTPEGLAALDARFLEGLKAEDPPRAAQLEAARTAPESLSKKEESALLLALAPALEDFLVRLFGIGPAVQELVAAQTDLAPLYTCKRTFIQRQVAKTIPAAEAATLDGEALRQTLAGWLGEDFDELAFARAVMFWSAAAKDHAEPLAVATRYAAWALHSPAGRARHGTGILFQVAHKTDPEHLVPLETVLENGVPVMRLPETARRLRQGFDLTDPGVDLAGGLDQANYCIVCHHQGRDTCRGGHEDRTHGGWQKSPFGVLLAGCPLDEKISEMHSLKREGHPLAALATIVVDNPLCAATGHRICNDCMKACIYQKQEPVHIPQAETRILKDVLALPWGFEIYSLLTRWNPLNLRQPVANPASGYKVLVVGMGPAGFGLAHQLLNQGHAVVGVDGLKIEPLPADLSGVTPLGTRVPFQPVRDVATLYERLDERVMAGFGGVAEYGITVRWNKNFLKIIRLLLERRAGMTLVGGVRFGGTLTFEDAFAAGFDHIALCMGAGRPTVIAMANGLARGVRQASDFLMALQLTGAAKSASLANLLVELPVVVVGGGLTAIDTATEALAYYPVQVEKFLTRFETLAAEQGEAAVRGRWTAIEAEVAETFLTHARALRAERTAAAEAGREPRIQALLDAWGGSTIAYRRRLIDAPSYTLNHEEVALGMQEGIRFIERATPIRVEIDPTGHATGLTLAIAPTDGSPSFTTTLPARTILIAAGTQPNTVLARELPDWLRLNGKHFQAYDLAGQPVSPEPVCKPQTPQILVARHDDGRTASFFGDLHPSFAGNVVKALGGAKQGAPLVDRVIRRRPPTAIAAAALAARLNADLRATVHAVTRLTDTIVEVVLHAPQAARNFQPGQFYRLQNFETLATRTADTLLTTEGMALTGAWVDREKGLLAVIVLEMGGSTTLCAHLKPGEPVVLMGPTGAPTHIKANETVALVGGGLGNAVLFSIGQASREQGCRVLYFAGYKKVADRYKVEQIERAADRIVWCCDEAPGFAPTRPGDLTFVGNIVDAIRHYAEGKLGTADIPLPTVDRLIVIGSDRMMAAVAQARHTVLKPWLKPDHIGIGSINSPMQCMMKEICAQCLQLHRDPESGEEEVVFSCFNQDQNLDRVDFAVLNQRLAQNTVHEKLTAQWIARCLRPETSPS